MWNKPSDQELAQLPRFYSTENVPLKKKVLHLHFFLGDCDWYAAEYSPDERIFFGFACLNGDLEMAEWGYFSLDELLNLKVKLLEVDRDLHFPPTKAIDVDLIRKAQRWEKGEPHECKVSQ